jgi:hypothetical protein
MNSHTRDHISLPPPPGTSAPSSAHDRRIGIAATVLTAVGYGVNAGWWTPRGPITTPEALATIVLSLVVGATAGFTMRCRWSMFLATVTFAAPVRTHPDEHRRPAGGRHPPQTQPRS